MKFSKLHPTIFGIEVGATLVYYVVGYLWIVSLAGKSSTLGTEFDSPDMKGLIPFDMVTRLFESPWSITFLVLFPFLPFITFAIVNQIILAFTANDKV